MEIFTKDVVGELLKRRGKDVSSDAAASRVVQEVFAIIAGHLTAGDSVSISRFGTFYTIHSAARVARKPVTGEAVDVPAKRRARLRTGRFLRLALDDDGHNVQEKAQ